MRKCITMALCAAMLLPSIAFGWGERGHSIVAEIAFSMMGDNAKRQVKSYLGGTSIEAAATWMDDMRSNRAYGYMKRWHYVNIDKGSAYKPANDNIIWALNNAIDVLQHKNKHTDDEVKQNLEMAIHLVGDLHMPLHAGYGNDKGGNDVQVQYQGHGTNLHKVWDTKIIESENITTASCQALLHSYSKTDIARLQAINVVSWIDEPRSLLGGVYAFSGHKIDQAYIDKNKPVIERQLLIAGIRLAAVLNACFR